MAPSQKVNSGYINGLRGPDLERYKTILKMCDNVDPYEISLIDLSDDINLIPDVNFVHITQYMVNTTRSTTMKQMCAYKGTEAHQFVTSGFVQKVLFYKLPSDKVIVVGRVKHSQTLSVSAKPLLPWVLVDKNADILVGWCTCKAGCGEVCSHVGALLYALEIGANKKGSLTCTSKQNSWLPPAMKEVPLSEVRHIDFMTSHLKRRKMLQNASEGSDDPLPVNLATSSQCRVSKERLASLVKDIHDQGLSSAIFRVLDEYREEFAHSDDIEMPQKLTDLFDATLCNESLDDLLVRASDLYSACKITLEQREYIEKHTRSQSNCYLWKAVKAGRPSGSTMYDVTHTSITTPSITLVKKICYPFDKRFVSPWMQRGLNLEPVIRQLYLEKLMEEHEGVEWKESGFWIPLEAPFMGASPDGVIRCKCCGVGLWEGKALKFPLEDSDKVPIKHFYQIQTELFCVGFAKYCDYVVYIGDDIGNGTVTIKRVYPDTTLQEEIVEKSEQFFRRVLLVELLSRYFSTLNVKTQVLRTNDSLSQSRDLVCHCQKPRENPMIKCMRKDCDFVWYHLRCMQLAQTRKNWVCPLCQQKTS